MAARWGHQCFRAFNIARMSPARDEDSKSRIRALSQGCDVIDKSHLSEWNEKRKGLNHEVQLLGAE